MKPKLKTCGEFHWKFEDFFATKILSEKYNLQKVDKNPELTITLTEPRPLTKEFKKSKIKLLVAGENIFYKINIFKAIEYFSKKTKVNMVFLNKHLPIKFLNIKLGFIRKEYLNYIKNIVKKNSKREYAIITNNISGKNIFILPFFLQVKQIRDNLNKLFKKPKINKIPKKFCCIIISNESAFDRIEFTKKLSKYKQVDIYGKTSLTNSDNSKLPSSFAQNHKFYSQYKFVICFENSFAEEYITEKLPNAMLGNAIPIYRGAPNVKDYFNTNSLINYDNHQQSYDKMIEKIIELDKDDKKYLEFINRPWMNENNFKKVNEKEKELADFLESILP